MLRQMEMEMGGRVSDDDERRKEGRRVVNLREKLNLLGEGRSEQPRAIIPHGSAYLALTNTIG